VIGIQPFSNGLMEGSGNYDTAGWPEGRGAARRIYCAVGGHRYDKAILPAVLLYGALMPRKPTISAAMHYTARMPCPPLNRCDCLYEVSERRRLLSFI
jgi:hypothetical protein